MSTSTKVGPFRVRPQLKHGNLTGKWFLDIPARLTGNSKRMRKLYPTRSTATAVARELKRRVDPVSGHLLAKTPQSGLVFGEAVERWRVDEELRVQTLKKRESTLQTEVHRLKSLAAFFGNDDLASISERRLGEYQRWRLELGRSPHTINGELAAFSLVMRWALKHRYLVDVPKVERIPVRRKKAVIPTPEEAVRIIEMLPPRLRPLVRFLCETGCRKGEALNLTWDCVDEVNGFVEILAREGWTPKTEQSERRIPLNRALLEMIRGLPKTGPYVFSGNRPDKPIRRFERALNTAIEKADIRRNGKQVHLTPQSFRKANATWQAMRGVNESVLQGLLGHAAGSSVTKQYYVHATEEAKRAAVIELPFGEHKRNGEGEKLATFGNRPKRERHDLSGPVAKSLKSLVRLRGLEPPLPCEN